MSEYVLNNASIAEPYAEAATARVHLADLLKGLALLDSDSSVLPSLRLNVDPWLQPLVQENASPPITLGELAHGFYGTVDHDLAAFFDSLNRSVPADQALDEASVDAILRIEPDGPALDYQPTFASIQAAGTDAIICAVMNFTLVGLLRCDLWRFDRMGFVSRSETYVFDHVAEPCHAEAIHSRRLADRRYELTARSFWTQRNQVFPHLLFGLDVQDQIEKFSTTLMPLMFRRLAELDSRVRSWREAPIAQVPDGTTAISKETSRTMMRYGTARKFRGHDGAIRIFEDHMWVDRSHRIHLFMDVSEKRIEVGYIGRHLPTMNYST